MLSLYKIFFIDIFGGLLEKRIVPTRWISDEKNLYTTNEQCLQLYEKLKEEGNEIVLVSFEKKDKKEIIEILKFHQIRAESKDILFIDGLNQKEILSDYALRKNMHIGDLTKEASKVYELSKQKNKVDISDVIFISASQLRLDDFKRDKINTVKVHLNTDVFLETYFGKTIINKIKYEEDLIFVDLFQKEKDNFFVFLLSSVMIAWILEIIKIAKQYESIEVGHEVDFIKKYIDKNKQKLIKSGNILNVNLISRDEKDSYSLFGIKKNGINVYLNESLINRDYIKGRQWLLIDNIMFNKKFEEDKKTAIKQIDKFITMYDKYLDEVSISKSYIERIFSKIILDEKLWENIVSEIENIKKKQKKLKIFEIFNYKITLENTK